MRFPPPVRLFAPLVALTFGLLATWFEYRLNLGLDLARHFTEMRERADNIGRRLARRSERRLATGQRAALHADINAIAEISNAQFVAVVDGAGEIVADNTRRLAGQRASQTAPLAGAAALINRKGKSAVRLSADQALVFSAHPFPDGERGTGWALLGYERSGTFDATLADAGRQLSWMAGAMTLLGLALWGLLHFFFAARLARLASGIRSYGEGRQPLAALPAGGDEVGELSVAFSGMAQRLDERAAEQLRLEREVLEISENERRRIGHDLHDSLGQRLTAASMAASALATALQGSAPTLAPRCEEIGRQLRDAIAEARSLSHGLAPVALTGDGLSAALKALAEDAGRGGVRGVFEGGDAVRVDDPEIAGQLYRVAQEAVTNALKHAGASEIRIGLEQHHGRLQLEVDDDGNGFEPGTPEQAGIGLRVMHYRARLIGAELTIGPAPAGGTRVSLRVNSPA